MHTITEMVLCSEAGTPALSPLRGGFQQLTHNVNGKPVKWACQRAFVWSWSPRHLVLIERSVTAQGVPQGSPTGR